MLLQTFAIKGRSINNFDLRDGDTVLHPLLAGIAAATFTARNRSTRSGKEAMRAQLRDLRTRVLAKTR